MSDSKNKLQMELDDFPALYLAADEASNEAQNELIWCYRLNSILLILAAVFAAFECQSRVMSIISTLLFLGSLGLFIYGKFTGLQGKWYSCRALAESIKTAVWRFIMKAEPFSASTEESLSAFRKLLDELLADSKSLGTYLSGNLSGKEQLTFRMLEIREAPYDSKRNVYRLCRIEDQHKWYAKKSGDNRKASTNWFICTCVLYAGATVLLLIRIADPTIPHLPIGLFAVAASSVIGWVQLKRFDELSSAYGFTAHEIGMVKSRFSSVSDDESLARFVSDAENAFSREHTQWAARRDH